MSNFYLKGETIFLYNQFLDSEDNTIIINNPKVRILHNYNNDIYEDLPWTSMEIMSPGEYFYNYNISLKSDLGQYQVIYSGESNGNTLYNFEFFNVIPISVQYENVIKIYGYISDLKIKIPIIDSSISVYETNSEEIVFNSLSNFDGYWEAFLYPGEYRFVFSKPNYIKEEITVQIGEETTEIQFTNVTLNPMNSINNGNGVHSITEIYTLKDGTPLSNLNIKIYDSLNPAYSIAEDITNEEGKWNCFLNPGNYLLKINGIAFDKQYNQIFRIKVFNNGSFKFENIKKNNSVVQSSTNNGSGSVLITDTVLDKFNNPIVDVQVNAFKSTDLNSLIAQDYTDLQGNWALNLNPGEYELEFYHPRFQTFIEKRTIN